MSEDELSQEQAADEIQELLSHCGAVASPRLIRLRRLSASMQSLEWQLARKGTAPEPAQTEEEG